MVSRTKVAPGVTPRKGNASRESVAGRRGPGAPRWASRARSGRSFRPQLPALRQPSSARWSRAPGGSTRTGARAFPSACAAAGNNGRTEPPLAADQTYTYGSLGRKSLTFWGVRVG